MSKEVKNTVIITVFAVISGLVLSLVHGVTSGVIDERKKQELREAYAAVLAEAADFNDIESEFPYADSDHNAQIDSALTGVDASGAAVGYVVNVTSHGGYGGDISFSIGIKADGTIENVSITAISETPGLGMRAQTEPDFLNQFKEQSVDTEFVVKDNIQAISSATFTSKCLTNGINAATAYYKNNILAGGAN